MSSKPEKDLTYRSEFLLEVFKDFIDPEWSILEIGCGDGRNLRFLREAGYKQIDGVDKETRGDEKDFPPFGWSTYPIEEYPYLKAGFEFDVVFSMSCFFLIPPENNWVFEKIAKMAKRYIITIEGETGGSNGIWGRDYTEVFKEFGFTEVLSQKNVFNEYGVLRVLERNG